MHFFLGPLRVKCISVSLCRRQAVVSRRSAEDVKRFTKFYTSAPSHGNGGQYNVLDMYGEETRYGVLVWPYCVQYMWGKLEKLPYVQKTDH